MDLKTFISNYSTDIFGNLYWIYNPGTLDIIDYKIVSLNEKPPKNSVLFKRNVGKDLKIPKKFFPKFYNPLTKEVVNDDLNTLKLTKLKKLKNTFKKSFELGFNSKIINKKINSTHIDLINMKNLYDNLGDNKVIKFRTFDNAFVVITKEQLAKLIKELGKYFIELYQRKWELENKITYVQTYKELLQIKWDDYLNPVEVELP